jgi:hypothetical protein
MASKGLNKGITAGAAKPGTPTRFVVGSRPSGVRAPSVSVKGIKPNAASTRDYAKNPPAIQMNNPMGPEV